MNLKEFNKLNDILKTSLLRKSLKNRGYVVFDSSNKYDLQLVFIRNANNINSTGFNDLLVILYNDNNGVQKADTFNITTDPGVTYRRKPINHKGTAVVLPQQVRKGFKLGLHKGYPALVQNKDFAVLRDNNRDKVFYSTVLETPKEIHRRYIVRRINLTTWLIKLSSNISIIYEKGRFGINCHIASKWKILENIGLYSAGCMVHQDPYRYRKVFLPLIKKSAAIYGDEFTFTLITSDDIKVK